jgi:CelD/BcsL family acetyltransferase involved in cellulose biosynthesis
MGGGSSMIERSDNCAVSLGGPASVESDSITYEVARDLSAVVKISAEWDALLSHAQVNQAFGSSKWFIATCRNDASISPYVIFARRRSRLAGVLPLAIIDGGEAAAFPNYLCDYNDIVASKGDEAVITGLINHALSNSDGYKKIIMPHIRRDSNCLRAIQLLEPRRATQGLYRESHVCYYIDIPASYGDYLAVKGSRFRKRLKRIRANAHRGNMVVRELSPENFSPDGLAGAFLSLHLSRHGERSCFEPARGRLFVEEVLPALFRERRIRVIALFEGERMVGIDVYTMGAASLCAWNGGFLSEVEAFSPGKLLIDAGVNLACDLKLEEYDFMRGAEAYKMNWMNGSRPLGQIELGVY